MNPIEELSPKGVWKNFYSLTQIPRPSGHTEQVAKFLVDFAKQHGAEAHIDELIAYENANPQPDSEEFKQEMLNLLHKCY